MNEKTKRILLQIFATKIGWLAICSILVVLFSLLSRIYPWAETMMAISAIYPIVMSITLLVFGLIINPIRSYKENQKK